MAEQQVRNFNINFGPQHPAAHGVLRLVLELDGEVRPDACAWILCSNVGGCDLVLLPLSPWRQCRNTHGQVQQPML